VADENKVLDYLVSHLLVKISINIGQQMKIIILSIAFGLLLPVVAAHADQCALVPKRQALDAITRLDPGQTIYQLCELCGEKKPQPIVVKTVALTNYPQTNLWRIKINDSDIDLAYTYVESSITHRLKKPGSWINLSLLANCPADGYTPILTIK
jgi:hypothetical protein